MLNSLDLRTTLIPNQVTDVYKVRRGKYTNVKVWSYIDLGTCRKIDLFITDANYGTIEGFKTIHFMFEDDKEIMDFLEKLNSDKVQEIEEEVKPEIKIEEITSSKINFQSKKGDGKFGGLF